MGFLPLSIDSILSLALWHLYEGLASLFVLTLKLDWTGHRLKYGSILALYVARMYGEGSSFFKMA